MKKIAIFASGSGSNAENIIQYFKKNNQAEVACVYTNKISAYVLERAAKHDIPSHVFTKKELAADDGVVKDLQAREVDLIVLAGFLLLVPEVLVKAYPGRIINIHPALLPAYGGKGMYGRHVHEAVIADKAKKSGITIHVVNEHYDEGAILFQAECSVDEDDTPDSLAQKIHTLEYRHFPEIIHKRLQEL